MSETVVQIFRLSFIGIFNFFAAILLVPLFFKLVARFNLRKKIYKEDAPVFQSLHSKKQGTPTMGGLIFLLAVLLTTSIFYLGDKLKIEFLSFFNFVNRRETFLPLFAFFFSGFIGFLDDLFGLKTNSKRTGLRIKEKLIIYTSLAILGAWWFVAKLNFNFINLDSLFFFVGTFWFIFYFIFVFLAVSFSANETDGLDGLLAGISLSILFAHLIIAFLNQDYHLAAFISSLIGSLTAFLWFNVYPAKFFMGDTGSMSLGVTIAILSFLSGTTLLLPLMAPIFVLESGSVILQVLSKKIRKKKIFLSTPIHHHFEAKGLPEPTIVFRFWVVNAIGSILATVIYLVIKFYGS